MEYWILFSFIVLILTLVITFKRKQMTITDNQKCVFISGCDSGIGYKLAIHLDILGCSVYAGCLVPDGEGAKLLREESSDRLKIVPLDVTKEKCIYEAVNWIKEDLNGKDLWAIINNAGVCIFGEFDWLTPKQCRLQLDVNLYGTISVTKAFLPLIRQSKGRIINITSVNGQCAYPGLSVYCASKFGLEGFSDALRLELAKFGVRVVVVQPGDFARLTQIMTNHQTHMKEMWDHMNEKDKNVYDGYFQKYHENVMKNYGLTSAQTFGSTSLLKDIEEALFSTRPPSRYTVAPLPFKIFFFLVRLLPTRWGDLLMLYIMRKIFDAELRECDK